MIDNPLADYDGTPVEREVLETFGNAFVRHTQSRYQPRALWRLPDGRYLADLLKAEYGGGLTYVSSTELNCVFTDLVHWESRFREDRNVEAQIREGTDAFVVGALMDHTGEWHFYVVLGHVGEPPPNVKTITTIVRGAE